MSRVRLKAAVKDAWETWLAQPPFIKVGAVVIAAIVLATWWVLYTDPRAFHGS